MVDIVQSNVNKLLIRKIGYSVGLESTLKRINELVALYIGENQVSARSWKKLITNTYNRTDAATKHFENLFDSLGILLVSSGRPIPQPVLDACAILKNFYHEHEEKYNRAIKAVVLYSLVISDGELFCALLDSNFDQGRYESSLTKFRGSKLTLFYEKYPAKSLRSKLHRVINFEDMTQEKKTINKTSLSATKSPPFAHKRVSRTTQNLDDFKVSLSDDWYRKVPGRRQAWAEDLGLYCVGKATTEGQQFLKEMKNLLPSFCRQKTNSDSVIIMPNQFEMIYNKVTWSLDDELVIDFNNLIQKISNVYTDPSNKKELSSDILIEELLPFCYESYVDADVRFTRLRRELPYNIFALFCLGYCVAENLKFDEFDKVLYIDARNKIKYSLRSSRKSMTGISLKDQSHAASYKSS